MRAFVRLVTANLNRPLRQRDVSRQIGVSDRMLRTYCTAALGITPRRYIELQRLAWVRAALLCADPQTAQVAEIAVRGGFKELGRFAGRYRAEFGELPSETLRRCGRAVRDTGCVLSAALFGLPAL